jgi:hypothetical protein
MSANGYLECRAHVNEDYTFTITVEGDGTLTGTYAGTLYDPAGDEVADAVEVEISDAAARELTATIFALDLDPTTYYKPYRYEIRCTDAGARTVVAWGPLELTDPSRQGPPG